MSAVLDLKQIERKAFRSTYQDGLWDMYLGAIVAGMAIFVYRPESGYAPSNIILMLLIFAAAFGLFWAGKKFITLPRMGQVRFGPMRQQRKRILAIILGVIVLLQVGLVALTAFGWLTPILSSLGGVSRERLFVAALGSLMVGPSMTVIAFMNDFPRGYYIAVMMSLAVFLMILTNQWIYPLAISVAIILPGLVLFVRFIRRYPVQPGDALNV